MVVIGLAAALAMTGAAQAKTRPRPKPAAAATYILHISSHLAENAKVSIDGAAPVTTPGFGATVAKVAAGRHTLAVTSPHGVNYKGELTLDPAVLFKFEGKSYWCVNLLEKALQPYSQEECGLDVADRG
jgi:hypothetical protein